MPNYIQTSSTVLVCRLVRVALHWRILAAEDGTQAAVQLPTLAKNAGTRQFFFEYKVLKQRAGVDDKWKGFGV